MLVKMKKKKNCSKLPEMAIKLVENGLLVFGTPKKITFGSDIFLKIQIVWNGEKISQKQKMGSKIKNIIPKSLK